MARDGNAPIEYGDWQAKLHAIVRDGFSCCYCGAAFDRTIQGWDAATIDHLTPQCTEPKHGLENLRLACRSCNSAKGKRQLEDGSPAMKQFCEERKALRQDDDRWVRMTIPFIERLRAKGSCWPDPEALAAQLKPELDGFFSSVKHYTRSTTQHWLELEDRGRRWYFQTDGFLLQAYFVGPQADEHTRKALKARGFIREPDPSKLIHPFDMAGEGARLIKKEIDELIRLLDSAQASTSCSSGSSA